MAHILLVDDQQFTREFLFYELTQMGHDVSCVNNRDALFIFLEEHTPDLVLLDPNLNGFKGWDLLREIKLPGRPRMPTILFPSFEATLQDPRAGLADGYVIKNVDTQGLKEKMSEVLTHGQHSDSHHQRWSGPTQQVPTAAPGSFLLTARGDKAHGRP
jgi:DNA-binding response OmpR family regulator